MIHILIILAAIAAGIIANKVTHTSDSPVEEIAEEVIEMEIGAPAGSIHLSPQSKK